MLFIRCSECVLGLAFFVVFFSFLKCESNPKHSAQGAEQHSDRASLTFFCVASPAFKFTEKE